MTDLDIEKGRKNAIISYLTIIGVIIAYYLNDDQNKSAFTSFHVRQSLGLWLSLIVVNLSITSHFDIFMLRASVYIFFSILLFYGLYSAFNNKAQAVPLVGALYQKLFKNLGQ